MQIKLVSTSGTIPPDSASTFAVYNPGYHDINSLGLALCGYDLPAQNNLQFRAELSYDSTRDSFIVLVLPTNGTTFYYLNYYLVMANNPASSYLQVQSTCKSDVTIGLVPSFDVSNPSALNRLHYYTISSPFQGDSSVTIAALPFLRSMDSVSWGSYNYYNVSKVISISGSNAQVTVFLNYSMVAEVCLSILFYH